jgi:hypothetical protein
MTKEEVDAVTNAIQSAVLAALHDLHCRFGEKSPFPALPFQQGGKAERHTDPRIESGLARRGGSAQGSSHDGMSKVSHRSRDSFNQGTWRESSIEGLPCGSRQGL